MSTEGWQSLSVSSVPLSRPISLSDELAFEDKGHFWGGLLVAMIPDIPCNTSCSVYWSLLAK